MLDVININICPTPFLKSKGSVKCWAIHLLFISLSLLSLSPLIFISLSYLLFLKKVWVYCSFIGLIIFQDQYIYSITENWCRTHQYWEFDSEFATRSTEDVDSVSISQQSVSSLKKVMEKIELVSLWWGWPHTAGVFTASHYSKGVYKNNRLDVHQLTNTLRRVP